MHIIIVAVTSFNRYKIHSLQNLTSRIAYERPEDPLQFMLTEIEKVKKGEKLTRTSILEALYIFVRYARALRKLEHYCTRAHIKTHLYC